MHLENTIYQMFMISNRLQEKFYAGDLYLGIDTKDSNEKLNTALEVCLNNSDQDFFPTLRSQIQNLIGTENCIPDYYEMSNNGFCLFWAIDKTKYTEIMKKIIAWADYKQLNDFMFFNIKDENENVISFYGNEKVKNEYYNL